MNERIASTAQVRRDTLRQRAQRYYEESQDIRYEAEELECAAEAAEAKADEAEARMLQAIADDMDDPRGAELRAAQADGRQIGFAL